MWDDQACRTIDPSVFGALVFDSTRGRLWLVRQLGGPPGGRFESRGHHQGTPGAGPDSAGTREAVLGLPVASVVAKTGGNTLDAVRRLKTVTPRLAWLREGPWDGKDGLRWRSACS